jgi:hypothetical protein
MTTNGRSKPILKLGQAKKDKVKRHHRAWQKHLGTCRGRRLSILTLMGKSLVSERVVLAVSMIDQLLRRWALKRDLSAQAATIFEIGKIQCGLIFQIHATSHMFRFCVFQAFGRCCHWNRQVSKELGITILWVIKHGFECKALKPSIAMTRKRSNGRAKDAEFPQ